MIYQVIFQDEYDNLYHLGFYRNLEDSLENINQWLKEYDTRIDELKTYPSTFCEVFDKSIEVEEGTVMVRGFIFEDGDLDEVIPDEKAHDEQPVANL